MIYARSDVQTVKIAEGHEHAVKTKKVKLGDAERVVRFIECEHCEPILLQYHGDQWGRDPLSVPLTPDEQEMVEREAKEGEAAMNVAAREIGRQLAEVVRGTK